MSFLDDMAALPGEIMEGLGAPTVTVTRTTRLPQTIEERARGAAPATSTQTIQSRGFLAKTTDKADDGTIERKATARLLGAIEVGDRVKWQGSLRSYEVVSADPVAPADGAPSLTLVVLK